ncbi:MAG: hypothetical protein GY851_19885 [bacterium]|nr:hypothetical protein [bacterium]
MPSFSSLITDLTQEARQDRCRPAYGFEHLYPEVFQALSAPEPRVVFVVGPEGCGKSRFVEGLALAGAKALSSEPGGGLSLLKLGTSHIASPGQDLRTSFNELVTFMSTSPEIVLVADNAGAFLGLQEAAGIVEAANDVIAPTVLQAGTRCVAVLSDAEYAQLKDRVTAPADRVHVVSIPAFDSERRIDLLITGVADIERKRSVAIDGGALHAAAELIPRFAPDACSPDDLLQMLDRACVRYSRKAATAQANPELIKNTSLKALGDRVGAYDVVRTIEENLSVDIMNPVLNMKNALAEKMTALIPGQRETVYHVIDQLVNFRFGFSSPLGPAGMLLLYGSTDAPIRKVVEAAQQIGLDGSTVGQAPAVQALDSADAVNAALDQAAGNEGVGYLLLEHAESATPEAATAFTERVIPSPTEPRRSPLYNQFVILAFETPPGSGRTAVLDALKRRFPRGFIKHCGTMAPVSA